MRIQVRRQGAHVITLDCAPTETAAQVATRAAVAFDFDVWDAPWCLGEGESWVTESGAEATRWVPQVAPAAALDENLVYLLAVVPSAVGEWN